MSDLRWLFSNLHPQFPGGIGAQPNRIRRSGKREHAREPYRGREAASRRGSRTAYRRLFSRVESRTDRAGVQHRVRVWSAAAPGYKAWCRIGARP